MARTAGSKNRSTIEKEAAQAAAKAAGAIQEPADMKQAAPAAKAPDTKPEAKPEAKKKPALTVVPKTEVKSGNLNDSQHQALMLQNLKKIVALKTKATSASGELRAAYKEAKADGFTKKELDFAISLQNDDKDEMLTKRRRENQIARWLSHPIGTQSDMFDDSRPIRDRAFDEGKRDGAADLPLKAPNHYAVGTPGYEGYMEGWHAGQAAIANSDREKEDNPWPDDVQTA